MAVPATASAQNASRTVTAMQVDGPAPHLDGRLDDPAWQRARPASGFVQLEPVEGEPAPEDTEVRFLYTDDALYIGARMRSRDPLGLRTLVARRDTDVPSEQLVISLDTHQNRTTAYTFAITPGGIRTDYFHSSDRRGSRDYSFDPVWEVETAVDSAGWTAEIRIPFTQLRFNAGDEQVWGVNMTRAVPHRNEETFWVLVRRNEQGWSSRMGTLLGIHGIRPSRRVELLPYVAVEGNRAGELDPVDPFTSQLDGAGRMGADLKLGLGPALTLDATINPDFGQVEADPAEVNLTAFETFFSERRPFFTEGSNLFGGRGTFYSRRIGSRPPGSAGAPYAEAIDNSTILGAAKVTGRTSGGFSLGALGAATAREQVRTYDPSADAFGDATIAPFTMYGIVTGQQEFGRDRSTIKASVTAVERDLEQGGQLASVLTRRAWTGLIDGRWRWAGGRYDASAYVVATRVEGDSAAMLRLQRSSTRYFQRPDATHLTLDPSRTGLTGLSAGMNHSKMGGNWLWDIDVGYEGPSLEQNDLGTLSSTDDIDIASNIRYRQTEPGALFHTWSFGVFGGSGWNTAWDRSYSHTGFFSGVTWKNFWTTDVEFIVNSRAQSDRQTRGGPLMGTPLAYAGFIGLANAGGASTRWSIGAFGRTDELDGYEGWLRGSLSFRPGTRWELSFRPRYERSRTARQYVGTRSGGSAATFGGRYVFAEVERSEVVAQLRANFAVTPDFTIEAYVEPFASSGDYAAFGELEAARSQDLRTYGTDGTTITRDASGQYTVTDGAQTFGFGDPDFNIRSFRSNVVLRWEWRPGSTAYLVWQQNRFEGRPLATAGPRGLLEAFSAPGDQFLAVKISYWLAVR